MLGEIDIGHGVRIAPMWGQDEGAGFVWKHPACRAWFPLWLDARTTGHKLIGGALSDLSAITIEGSLLCPKGCKTHGQIKAGKWEPC